MSQTGPRFSILVAAFNVEATVGRCIESIVVAKNEHIVELVILDDGSTDRTAELCAQYAQRFPWMRVITQPNAGVSEVRNRALREAVGEYVAFVDGDDTIEPHYFDFIDGKLRETDADMLVFGHNRLQLDKAVFSRPNVQMDVEREEIVRMQLNVAANASIYQLCCVRMFRKKLTSGFVFDKRIKLGEDTAFIIHMMNRADRVVVSPNCIYNYFESATSLSSGTHNTPLLESFEAHYQARLRVHNWPQAGSDEYFTLKRSIALSYVEYVLQYLLNNTRLIPLSEQLGELTRIRQSIIYQQCIPDYAGRSRYRGVRFLVNNFVRERYRTVIFGIWLAGFLTTFRVFIIPSMLWRQQGMDRAPSPSGDLSALSDVDGVGTHGQVTGGYWFRRVWQETRESQFVRNVGAVATGIALAQAISFAFMPFLTRLYGPEAFGAVAAFTALLSIISPLSTLGYANAIVMPETEDGAAAVARLSLVCAAIVTPLAFVFVSVFQSHLARWTGLEAAPDFLYLIPPSLLLGALLSVANQSAIREELFKAKAGSFVFSTLLMNLGKLAGGLLAPSGLLLIVFSMVGNILNFLMLLARVPRKGVFKIRRWFGTAGIRRAAGEQREFAMYRMPHSIINAASLGLPVIVLTLLYGASEAGQYSITVLALGAPVTLLGQSVYEVFYPRITRAIQNEPDSAGALIGKATVGLFLVSVVPFGTIALFGSWIFPFVFGSEWGRAGDFSQWVALWMAASLATRPAVAAIPALRKQGALLVYEVVMTIVRVAALYAGYRIGNDITSIAAFALTNVVGYAALLLLVFISVAKYKEATNA